MDYTKKDVTDLASGLSGPASVGGYEVGAPTHFGLGLEVHDPVAGQIIIVARPHRSDIGQEQILLSPAQVAAAVTSARITRTNQDRAHGVLPLVVVVPTPHVAKPVKVAAPPLGLLSAIVKRVKAKKAAKPVKKAAAPKAKKAKRRKHKR